jgi:hypothetical protein
MGNFAGNLSPDRGRKKAKREAKLKRLAQEIAIALKSNLGASNCPQEQSASKCGLSGITGLIGRNSPGEECGRWSNGRLAQYCAKAGSEECDFECPYRDSECVKC